MKGFIRAYGPAAASGAALAISFPTWHLFFLAWVALVPLFRRAVSGPPARAALHFFLAGWVFHSLLLQWVLTNLMWAGGWVLLGQQLLCVYLALYWAALGWAWGRFRRWNAWLGGPVAASVLWGAMEQAQAVAFTGFGWSSLAYSQGPDLAFAQLAALGGAPLVSAVLVFVNASLAEASLEKPGRWAHGVSALVVFVIAHAAGWWMLDEADYTSRPFRVGLIQPDYSIEMKQDPEFTVPMVANAVEKSIVLARRTAPDLVVWPEALIMDNIDHPAVRELIERFANETETPLFTGSARSEPDPWRSYNSSYLLSASGQILGQYDKVHLAPYGEYVPLSNYLPFVGRVVPAIGDLVPGSELKAFPVGERTIGPLICFEVLFSPMAFALRDLGADILVVITNLAWFGASNAIPQELEIARFRAIETRLPLVHSANTGISGVFDPFGRFALINGAVDAAGDLWGLRDGIGPRDTIMHRLAGTLDVAAAARHPLSAGPRVVPWALAVLAGLLLVAAFVTPPAREAG